MLLRKSCIYSLGDIHGDIAALYSIFTLLKQEGIIDEDFLIKKSHTLFVVTGDMIDRGTNSADVVAFLAIFKYKNPNQVILLAGNHEYVRYYPSFVKEFEPNDFDIPEDIYATIGPLSNRFFGSLPIVLFIGVQDKSTTHYLQFCHGGMEFYDTKELFATQSATIINKLITTVREPSFYNSLLEQITADEIATDTLKNPIQPFIVQPPWHLSEKPSANTPNQSLSTLSGGNTGFLWSDFYSPQGIKDRGTMSPWLFWQTTANLDRDDIGFTSGALLSRALYNKNAVVALIRGHQHSKTLMPELFEDKSRNYFRIRYGHRSHSVVIITSIVSGNDSLRGRGFLESHLTGPDPFEWELISWFQQAAEGSSWSSQKVPFITAKPTFDDIINMLNSIYTTDASYTMGIPITASDTEENTKLETLIQNAKDMPHNKTEADVRKTYKSMQERVAKITHEKQSTFNALLKELKNTVKALSMENLYFHLLNSLWKLPKNVQESMQQTPGLQPLHIKEAKDTITEWFDKINITFLAFMKQCQELVHNYQSTTGSHFLQYAQMLAMHLTGIQDTGKTLAQRADTFIPPSFIEQLEKHHQALDKLLPAFRQAALDQQLIEESKKLSATLETTRSGNSDISPYAQILIKRARKYKEDLLKNGLAVPATLTQSPGLTAWLGQFEKLLNKIMKRIKDELQKSQIMSTLVSLIQQVLEHINVPLAEIKDTDQDDYAILWNYKLTLNKYQQLLQDLQKQGEASLQA